MAHLVLSKLWTGCAALMALRPKLLCGSVGRLTVSQEAGATTPALLTAS